MKKKKLAIIGAGDLGQQIAYLAEQLEVFEVVGFFDDFAEVGAIFKNIKVLGSVDVVKQFYENRIFDELMIGIGYSHFNVRQSFFERFKEHIPFSTIVHNSSYVDSSCTLGQGVIVYPGCTLDMNVAIGDNVLIYSGCTIAHDSTIGSHSFLSPGVCVAGFVTIEETVNLGIGTIIIDNVRISKGIRTGGGTVVTENLNEPGLYLGIPAKFVKSI